MSFFRLNNIFIQRNTPCRHWSLLHCSGGQSKASSDTKRVEANMSKLRDVLKLVSTATPSAHVYVLLWNSFNKERYKSKIEVHSDPVNHMQIRQVSKWPMTNAFNRFSHVTSVCRIMLDCSYKTLALRELSTVWKCQFSVSCSYFTVSWDMQLQETPAY